MTDNVNHAAVTVAGIEGGAFLDYFLKFSVIPALIKIRIAQDKFYGFPE